MMEPTNGNNGIIDHKIPFFVLHISNVVIKYVAYGALAHVFNDLWNSIDADILNKSELQDHDCISLYLELAIATTHRHSSRDRDLSNLEILEVAIESTQDLEPSEALGSASDAIFYIRYKDLSRVKSDVDCIAIVRRICHEQTGTFRLVGQIKTIPQKNKSSRTSILLRRRLGLYNPWHLSSPRLAQGKRNRGVVLARLRHFHKNVRQVK
ncbi:hypothetical protein F2Q70_00043752 [Brassica cretica]|uniref:Uncharacterized protein n=1 Tax=Brassica cretica TaxID=69181 RepID=A0A8S9KPP2_BRACR|nr:hypothetical protein F2Q70_00043752 [Brassica cretica]